MVSDDEKWVTQNSKELHKMRNTGYLPPVQHTVHATWPRYVRPSAEESSDSESDFEWCSESSDVVSFHGYPPCPINSFPKYENVMTAGLNNTKFNHAVGQLEGYDFRKKKIQSKDLRR